MLGVVGSEAQRIGEGIPEKEGRQGATGYALSAFFEKGQTQSGRIRKMQALDKTSPATFRRRILLLVTGLSPQVVTETLYALTQQPNERFTPTEVHLLTTAEGAERARLSLLSDQPGWFRRLCEDFSLGEVAFDAASVRIIKDAQGQELTDIRTLVDNEAAADAITDTVREFTGDADSALHLSISGGRKTMGFYAGYALSLYGRPQDRLSHVLVSEPFEASWDFFYPTPYSQVINTRHNTLADTRKAEVTLALIPFVSLRHGLPERLLDGAASFSATVDAAQQALGPPHLRLDAQRCCVHCGAQRVDMRPAEFAFYAWIARRCQQARPPVRWSDEGWEEEFLAEYRPLRDEVSGNLERVVAALDSAITKNYFDQRKAKTLRTLRAALGKSAAKPYLIQSFGSRSDTRYGLNLLPEQIVFESF
jgi:CRISPR-associated protein (TIGR02584 family)